MLYLIPYLFLAGHRSLIQKSKMIENEDHSQSVVRLFLRQTRIKPSIKITTKSKTDEGLEDEAIIF